MKLSERLHSSSKHIWDKIIKHPFVVELYRGTLPLDKFKYYVIQDYNFLIGMTRAFSILASKTSDYWLLRKALELAYGDVTVEMDNYVKLLDRLNLRLEDVVKTEPSPTNYAYVNHVLSTCMSGQPIECLVATLPCFWSYLEIAEYYREVVEENKNEIYRDWIKTYLSKEYRELTEDLINTVDSLWKGNDIEVLEQIFRTSSRYEYMFWDMGYRLEKWPI